MRYAPLTLATADEIRAIYKRARDALDALLAEDEDEDEDEYYDPSRFHLDRDRFRAVIEALRFCCVAAGQLGDPRLIPLISEILALRRDFDDYPDKDVTVMAEGVAWILRAGAPAGREVKALARHADARVREAI